MHFPDVILSFEFFFWASIYQTAVASIYQQQNSFANCKDNKGSPVLYLEQIWKVARQGSFSTCADCGPSAGDHNLYMDCASFSWTAMEFKLQSVLWADEKQIFALVGSPLIRGVQIPPYWQWAGFVLRNILVYYVVLVFAMSLYGKHFLTICQCDDYGTGLLLDNHLQCSRLLYHGPQGRLDSMRICEILLAQLLNFSAWPAHHNYVATDMRLASTSPLQFSVQIHSVHVDSKDSP